MPVKYWFYFSVTEFFLFNLCLYLVSFANITWKFGKILWIISQDTLTNSNSLVSAMDKLFVIPYRRKSFEVVNKKHKNWLVLLQELGQLSPGPDAYIALNSDGEMLAVNQCLFVSYKIFMARIYQKRFIHQKLTHFPSQPPLPTSASKTIIPARLKQNPYRNYKAR